MKNIIHLLIFALFMFSCNSFSKQKIQVEEERLTQLDGYYDAEHDTWINPNTDYSFHTYFQGNKYASFNALDHDGNSLGLGLVDKTGKVLVQPIYNSIQIGFSYGLCSVSDAMDKKGLVNEQGIEIIKTEYDHIVMTDEYFAIDSTMILVFKNDKVGFINKQGEIVVPIKYNSLDLVGKNRIMFTDKPARWGIMDYSGKIIIPAIFTHTNTFINGKMTLQNMDGEKYTIFEDGRKVKQ